MAGRKRSTSSGDSSPTENKRKKGSLNSFSCDTCRKSKIKCQPVPGQDQCKACAKKSPKHPCVRTGIDNRSNDTTTAKLNSLATAFKSIYDDFYSVFCILLDPAEQNARCISMMLRVSNPTTFLPVSGKEKPRNWKYPNFCTFQTHHLRLVELRNVKDSFSAQAWTYVRKLYALLHAFIWDQLSPDHRKDIGAILVKIQGNGGMFCNIVESFEEMNPNVVLDAAAHEDDQLLDGYKNKLVHEQGLDLHLKTPKRQAPRAEMIDLTGDLPESYPSPTSLGSSQQCSPTSSLSAADSAASASSSVTVGRAGSKENSIPAIDNSAMAHHSDSQSSHSAVEPEPSQHQQSFFGEDDMDPKALAEFSALLQSDADMDLESSSENGDKVSNTPEPVAEPSQSAVLRSESPVIDPDILNLSGLIPQPDIGYQHTWYMQANGMINNPVSYTDELMYGQAPQAGFEGMLPNGACSTAEDMNSMYWNMSLAMAAPGGPSHAHDDYSTKGLQATIAPCATAEDLTMGPAAAFNPKLGFEAYSDQSIDQPQSLQSKAAWDDEAWEQFGFDA